MEPKNHLTPQPEIHEADQGYTICSSEERYTNLNIENIEESMEKIKHYNAGALPYMGQSSRKGESDEVECPEEEMLERKERKAQHGINPTEVPYTGSGNDPSTGLYQ